MRVFGFALLLIYYVRADDVNNDDVQFSSACAGTSNLKCVGHDLSCSTSTAILITGGAYGYIPDRYRCSSKIQTCKRNHCCSYVHVDYLDDLNEQDLSSVKNWCDGRGICSLNLPEAPFSMDDYTYIYSYLSYRCVPILQLDTTINTTQNMSGKNIVIKYNTSEDHKPVPCYCTVIWHGRYYRFNYKDEKCYNFTMNLRKCNTWYRASSGYFKLYKPASVFLKVASGRRALNVKCSCHVNNTAVNETMITENNGNLTLANMNGTLDSMNMTELMGNSSTMKREDFTPSRDSNMETGMVVGIVVGCILFIALIVFIVVIIVRRRKTEKKLEPKELRSGVNNIIYDMSLEPKALVKTTGSATEAADNTSMYNHLNDAPPVHSDREKGDNYNHIGEIKNGNSTDNYNHIGDVKTGNPTANYNHIGDVEKVSPTANYDHIGDVKKGNSTDNYNHIGDD